MLYFVVYGVCWWSKGPIHSRAKLNSCLPSAVIFGGWSMFEVFQAHLNQCLELRWLWTTNQTGTLKWWFMKVQKSNQRYCYICYKVLTLYAKLLLIFSAVTLMRLTQSTFYVRRTKIPRTKNKLSGVNHIWWSDVSSSHQIVYIYIYRIDRMWAITGALITNIIVSE